VYSGRDKPSRSYIPVCHDDSLVCITFPNGEYKGTTFEDASVEVTVLAAAKTAKACLTPGENDPSMSPDGEFQIDRKSPKRVINGANFLHASRGGAGMNHHIGTDRYRGYLNGRCYELALNVTSSGFGAYDPGAIKEFTRRDEKHVRAKFTRILDSFRLLH
jgi:hypothetical protein